MKSGHEEIREMLPEYARGALQGEIGNIVEGHVKECPLCREDLSLLTGLLGNEVADPGMLFWKTLPLKVETEVRQLRRSRAWPSFLLVRVFPVAAAVAIVLFIALSLTEKKEVADMGASYQGDFTAGIPEYQGISEKDIAVITERLAEDEWDLAPAVLPDNSYHAEVVSMSGREIESLYKTLDKEGS